MSPGIVGEGAPFSRDQWGVITVLARSHDARMFVEFKSNLGFERKAGTLKDDLWAELVSRNLQYNRLSLTVRNAILI